MGSAIDDLDDLAGGLRAGPFHTALRAAIASRGLALERLSDRLAAAGLRVSVSTLSNWQRGLSRPRRPEGLRAVAALEELLGLPAHSLRGLLDEPAHRGRRLPAPAPGTPALPASRLRARLDVPADPALDVLAVQDDVTVTETGWTSTTRTVVRARRAGVDRHVVLSHVSGPALPEIRAGRDCALGRVHADRAAGLIGAELRFGALGPGETFAVEHVTTSPEPERYCGHWFRTAGQRFDLTVRFAPGLGIRRAHRIWRLDPHRPHRDVAGLRLIDGRLAHFADFDLSPGFHGIRWAA
ncbi:hypothetical protein ACFVHB_15675 [Kitasatospora sp. NPDC127111]|uniref:hypothetical protein n=1 Tax=Kitasatospora sp. NPDC127111 TaxID=3345363 RepID=UPI003635588B